MNTTYRGLRVFVPFLFLAVYAFTDLAAKPTPAAPAKAQIKILYDAFGKSTDMQEDWGYSALIECGGKPHSLRYR